MRVGIGYSENPDTATAGRQVAEEALARAGGNGPCDVALLFSTARHDAEGLRAAVAEVAGAQVPIVGGGAVGAITNDRFGYAGDQVIMAAIWLEGVGMSLFSQGGLKESEREAGERLGEQMARAGVGPDSPVLLFYDAIDRFKGNLRLLMATWLLDGIEKGLGFLPDIVGAGLQGDHICSAMGQWNGKGVCSHHALALAFSGDIRMDSAIMHGCRPATGYYTVTRADGPVILEINGQPALDFLDSLLGPDITRKDYPFFLILGVNRGDKWGEFDENSYANSLCLTLDEERGGLVMFEPNMTEGTEFQIMFRSMDLDYMIPRVEEIFNRLEGREPVLALYIDCAGRAAGYAGIDLEDAVMVQKTVAGRAPLLGIYSGVEIARVMGRPQGLDWTGVFCVLSVPR